MLNDLLSLDDSVEELNRNMFLLEVDGKLGGDDVGVHSEENSSAELLLNRMNLQWRAHVILSEVPVLKVDAGQELDEGDDVVEHLID